MMPPTGAANAEGPVPRTFTTGIFPDTRLREAIAAGWLHAPEPFTTGQVQPASVDLRLGPVGYRIRASFLPGRGATVGDKLADVATHEIDLTRPAVLERGCVYLVPLLEAADLPADVSARANPKSSIGRLDLFTRLITDRAETFESVAKGYCGPLYVEIVPRTFSVVVRQGTRLNQLRLVRGNPPPSDSILDSLHARETLVYGADAPGAARIDRGLWISIDLSGADAGEIIGYRARRYAPLVDLDRVDGYDPEEFFEPIARPSRPRLILDPDDFYILMSKERIRVPPAFAAEMIAYDTAVGEFRVHYAGFFDPGFGYGNDDIKGTPAVLEVRSHDVPFLLDDGQVVGRLIYERLLEPPERSYGAGIGSSYEGQRLRLAKQFRAPRARPL